MSSGWGSAEWDRAYGDGELTWEVEPHPLLAEAIEDRPPGRAVELGCGEGRQAIWLAGHGWRVSAVDFSPVAIERARALAARHGVDVEWVVADVTTYPPPTADLVVVLYLHLPREVFLAVLRRAAAALAPGGALVVLGWARTSPTGPGPAEVRYDADELVGALDGLRIAHAGPVPQAGSSDAVDTLLVATRP